MTALYTTSATLFPLLYGAALALACNIFATGFGAAIGVLVQAWRERGL